MAETVILSSTFDSGFDGWSRTSGTSHDGVGAIEFFDATAENEYIYKEGISVPSGSTSVTLSITFSASASDWFYFAFWADGFTPPEVTATFSDGKASIAKNSYGSPATGPGVTLLDENVAEIHVTDAGAALILNGVQVGFTAGYTLSGDVGAMRVVDIGSLAVGSSLIVTGVSLSASDSPVDPVDPVDPPAPLKVGMPAGFDSSWEAAQEVERSKIGSGPQVLLHDTFPGEAGEPELIGRTPQVGGQWSPWPGDDGVKTGELGPYPGWDYESPTVLAAGGVRDSTTYDASRAYSEIPVSGETSVVFSALVSPASYGSWSFAFGAHGPDSPGDYFAEVYSYSGAPHEFYVDVYDGAGYESSTAMTYAGTPIRFDALVGKTSNGWAVTGKINGAVVAAIEGDYPTLDSIVGVWIRLYQGAPWAQEPMVLHEITVSVGGSAHMFWTNFVQSVEER